VTAPEERPNALVHVLVNRAIRHQPRPVTEIVRPPPQYAVNLIHDRDPLFTTEFLNMVADFDVESVRLPPRSPNLNAHAERFVRSIKESCLERMILFGEESLRTAISNFVAHYHTERNHQGLANRLISPESGHLGNAGMVQRRQRLGGMLNYYYRAAA